MVTSDCPPPSVYCVNRRKALRYVLESYPYSEEYTEPTQYMTTRCPAWRIFSSSESGSRGLLYSSSSTSFSEASPAPGPPPHAWGGAWL
ncbi:hypothetical protein CRUP_030992 [Coryphaenoides rupestris]|nr:hypothetical protein CRUP_030992 [Coryphaenoides rupestris]